MIKNSIKLTIKNKNKIKPAKKCGKIEEKSWKFNFVHIKEKDFPKTCYLQNGKTYHFLLHFSDFPIFRLFVIVWCHIWHAEKSGHGSRTVWEKIALRVQFVTESDWQRSVIRSFSRCQENHLFLLGIPQRQWRFPFL